jgi:N-acetylneuraminic acid mutarotase
LSDLAWILALIALAGPPGEWRQLAPMPDKEGFAGSFAGVSHGTLLVAGGANFPGRKPWEGGQKVWHDGVYALKEPGGTWEVVGKLPRRLGYGVSVSDDRGVVCVGGGDGGGNSAEAFRLEWRGGELVRTALPPLPEPVANACGALVGGRLYVAGGQESPEARTTLRRAWRIDLSAGEPRWAEIEPWPGRARMLSVAAGCDGAFWIAGGVDLVAGEDGIAVREYLRDAFRYDEGRGWSRVADLPHAVTAAPSPAPYERSGFLVLGGDDGDQVGVKPGAHRGFRKEALRYDLGAKAWRQAGTIPAPRVTTPCVRWEGRWVVPGGEARPGVRSPEVWCFEVGDGG